MDIGTISLVLLLGLVVLLAIGMPLGLASAVLAVLVMVMKFEPDLLLAPWTFGDGLLTGRPGSGPLNILAQKIYGLLTDYVLISIPLFIFMAALLERSGIAKEMYSSLNVWLNRTRGGIAIVTSIMAVIMAAMSGIIGGEVVLLGLIALPQMLRLGYNQNLAIGTICASGTLGHDDPALDRADHLRADHRDLDQGALHRRLRARLHAGDFIILYIIVRTQLNPNLAPLPDPVPGEPQGREKLGLFAAFLTVLLGGFSVVLFLRALFFTVAGPEHRPRRRGRHRSRHCGLRAVVRGHRGHRASLLAFFVFGRARTARGWSMGKGLVPPIVVIGVVLGSIYGGITGITEAAGMGAIAVLIIAILRGEASFELVWDSLMRTLKSTGTIIWVTIGAAALAGAYTIAGGPHYVADLIVGSDLPTMGILLMMMLILLFMGAFMDWVGIVLLIIPVFLPIVQRLPIEEIGLFGEFESAISQRLVRRALLHEHAGQLPVAALRSGRILPEIGGAAAHLAHRYLPRASCPSSPSSLWR